MPEHQSWFRFLPGYESARTWFEAQFGISWYAKQELDLQHLGGFLLVLVLIALLAVIVHGKIRNAKDAVVPEEKLTVRTFFELITEMVLGQMEQLMGPREARLFLPLIGTCAFFILISNSLGLIPGFVPPTSNLNVTLACAVVVVISSEVYGFVRHGVGYLKEFLGPLNKWYHFFTLLPILLFVIEVISHLVRMMSLSVRLMGNMFADHTVAGVFLMLIPFVYLTALPVQLLGVLVIVVQTVVFCLLSMVYISMAIGEAEEHASEHRSGH